MQANTKTSQTIHIPPSALDRSIMEYAYGCEVLSHTEVEMCQ